MMPEISVIVPIYNSEKYLRRCIDSILEQTYTDFELILVNDGSSDKSPAICNEYKTKDSRVVVLNKKNGGAADARNIAIKWVKNNSSSKWICFADSDDCVSSRYLELLYEAVKKTDFSISECGYGELESSMRPYDEDAISFTKMNPEEFFCKWDLESVVPWGKLYKKELFNTIQFPTGKLFEDEYTIYRLLFTCDYIVRINIPLYFYSDNDESVTHSMWNPRKLDYFDAVNGQIKFFKKHKYLEALKKSIFWYSLSMHRQLQEVKREDFFYRLKMRNMFKRHLIRYHSFFSIKKYAHYYEDAFPFLMKLYWMLIGLMSKMRKNY